MISNLNLNIDNSDWNLFVDAMTFQYECACGFEFMVENAKGGYIASFSIYQESICEPAVIEVVASRMTILFVIENGGYIYSDSQLIVNVLETFISNNSIFDLIIYDCNILLQSRPNVNYNGLKTR